MNDDVKRVADDEKGLRRWVITGETAKKIVDQKALIQALRDGPRVKYVSELQRYKVALDELIGGEFVSFHTETKHFPLTGEIALTEVSANSVKPRGAMFRIDGEAAREIAEMSREAFRIDREIDMLKAERHDLETAINDRVKASAPEGQGDFPFALDPGRFDDNGTMTAQEVEDKPAGLAGLLRALAA